MSATQYGEVGDIIRKDGDLVRVIKLDAPNGTYFTSDGGCIGFDEVGVDDVFLESEIESLVSAYGCFACDRDSPKARTVVESERLAHKVGWRLGRCYDAEAFGEDSANAQIACPDCTSELLEKPGPIPLDSVLRESREIA